MPTFHVRILQSGRRPYFPGVLADLGVTGTALAPLRGRVTSRPSRCHMCKTFAAGHHRGMLKANFAQVNVAESSGLSAYRVPMSPGSASADYKYRGGLRPPFKTGGRRPSAATFTLGSLSTDPFGADSAYS